MAKKYILIFSCCFLFAFSVYSQTNVAPKVLTTADRYKEEFEIKGIPNADPELLSKIDIAKYNYLRQPDVRVEVKDPDNQLILILYSEREVAKKKDERRRQATNLKTVTDVQYIVTPKIEQK
jgi:hypothetical protein